METKGRAGRPPRLSRDKIVAMAIEIVTQEGYAKLSMRYLAGRLGTSPMGIYYYFESKNELLGFLFSRQSGLDDYRRAPQSQDPFERAVQTSEAVVRFLEAQSWALAGIVDGCIGVEEFTDNHLRELTDSVRDLGFDADDATETVRGIWRIALGEALIRSTPLIAAVDDRGAEAGVDGGFRVRPLPSSDRSLADTVESYLAGRLTRAHRRRSAG